MIRLFLPILIAFLATVALPAHAQVTYTCSAQGLDPITVVNPSGTDANKVSDFISRCTAAKGTASGPMEGGACGDGGRWATVSAKMVCQPARITSSTELSDRCLNAGSDRSQCSAAENTFIDNQVAVQNDPDRVPLDATAQARLLQQAQQQAQQQQRTISTGPASTGFCKEGTCTYTPLEPLPVPGGAQAGTDFGAFLSAMFRMLITFGGLFAVVMITVAGIGYMLSESAVDIDKAKGRAKAALWGLLLLMGSWLILNTINPDLLKFNLLSNRVNQAGSNTPAATAPQQAGANVNTTPDPAAKTSCESGLGAYNQKADGSWGCTYAQVAY